jgi:hypothetical protein
MSNSKIIESNANKNTNMQRPTRYHYFNNKKSVNLYDSIKDIYNQDTIIIKDNSEDIKLRGYYRFDNLEHYEHFYPAKTLFNVDEIILPQRPQRFKFDIDNYVNTRNLTIIKQTITEVFTSIAKLMPILMVLDSSGNDTEIGNYKHSCHIIVTNCYTYDAKGCKYITKMVKECLAKTTKNNILSDCVDNAVNGTVQHFRIPNSTKNNRVMCMPKRTSLCQCTVGIYKNLDNIDTPNHPNYLQHVNIEVPIGNAPLPPVNIDEKYILEKCKSHLSGWNFRCRINNMMLFNRTVKADNICDLCNKTHTGDNTRYLIILPNKVQLRCLRTSESKTILKINGELLDIGAKIKENTNQVEQTLDKKYDFKDYVHVDQQGMPSISNVPRTVYVKANMKMGKTVAAVQYMQQFKTIVVLSTRKTFTAEKVGAWTNYGFKSYENMSEISLIKTPRVVCQIESLHKFRLNIKPDLVVLDESESICKQFDSTTMSRHRPVAATFEWLLSNANKCLIMDATLGDSSVDLIRRIRGVEEEQCIVNSYKNMTGDKVYITTNKNAIISKILDMVKADVNIVIPTNSKKFADNIHKLITDIIPSDKVLKITSDTDDNVKADIFNNVNTSWANYQVVIYTPTCSAGISFTEKHFDTCIGFFTSSSTTVDSWRQAMYRVRDIASGNYYIYVNESYREEPRTMKQITKYLNTTGQNLFNKIDLKDIYDYMIDDNGCSIFKDTLLFDIHRHNVMTKNYYSVDPMGVFIRECFATGATIMAMPIVENNDVGSLYKEADAVITEANYQVIVNTPDICDTEFENIRAIVDKSDLIKQKLERKYLRKTYKYEGEIDMTFMQTYANPGIRRRYKWLKKIYQSDNIDISLACITEDSIKKFKSDGMVNNEHIKHEIAIELIKGCGFSNLDDDKIIIRKDLIANIDAMKDKLEKDIPKRILPTFLGKHSIKKWELMMVLRFINGILDTMYGIKITVMGRNTQAARDSFILKHNYYGTIFSRTKTELMPYIEPNWKFNPPPP